MDGGADFDLQSHSLASDGELEAARVIEAGARAGLRTIALTDHDSVEGVAEAVAAGEALGVRVVPAVEISAVHDAPEELHVLGYCVEHDDGELRRALARFREDRVARAAAMITALGDAGLAVDEHALRMGRRAEGHSLGRPHIADALLAHPDNAQRLAREGLEDVSGVIAAYLTPGRPGFAPRTLPSVAEAIECIHDAGGVAVWAHPFWDVPDTAAVLELLRGFRELGLDGVEAFYVTHSARQTRAVCEQAQALGLLRTGSSDFHGPHHRLFSSWGAFELYGCTPELGPIAG